MTGGVRESSQVDDLRVQFVEAALRVLREHGAAELTVRRVAEAAGSSTMGIYTRFGGRSGMLEAIYRHGFALLREVLTAEVRPGLDPTETILALAGAYRRFALTNPALYALLFERPLADFDPSPDLRIEALGLNFTVLVEQVRAAMEAGTIGTGDPDRHAYLLWTQMHGQVSIELTHAARSPLPGWYDSPEEGALLLLQEGIRRVLSGLAPH